MFPSLRKHPGPGQQGLGLVLRHDTCCDAKTTHGCGSQRWAWMGASWPPGMSPLNVRPGGPELSCRLNPAQDGRVGCPITQALTRGARTPLAFQGTSQAVSGSRCLKSVFRSFCKNTCPCTPLPHHPQGCQSMSSSMDTNRSDPPRARAGPRRSSGDPGSLPGTPSFPLFPPLPLPIRRRICHPTKRK